MKKGTIVDEEAKQNVSPLSDPLPGQTRTSVIQRRERRTRTVRPGESCVTVESVLRQERHNRITAKQRPAVQLMVVIVLLGGSDDNLHRN